MPRQQNTKTRSQQASFSQIKDTLFQQAPVAMVIVDSDRQITAANDRALSLFSTTIEALTGKDISILFLDERAVHSKLYPLFSTSARQPVELTCIDFHGKEFQGLHAVTEITDDGAPFHLLSITPLPETSGGNNKNNSLRIDELINKSHIAYTIHVGDTIVELNDFAVQLHGGSDKEQFIGRSILEFIPKEKHSAVRAQLRRLYSGAPLPVIQGRIQRLDGTTIWVDVLDILIHWQGEPAILSLFWDSSYRQEERTRLLTIAESVSGLTGRAFFEALVTKLSKLLDIDYVLIGEVAQRQPKRIQTIAFCKRGELLENFSYDVRNTPCSEVVANATCIFPSGIQQLYPDDRFFARHNIEAYIGIPLSSADGKVIGLIVLMNKEVIEDTDNIVSLLKIFAVRASAEIERRQYEKKISKSRSIFRTLAEASPAFIFMTDARGRFIYTNQRWKKAVGLPEENWGEDTIRTLIHPADRKRVLKSWRLAFQNSGHWEQEFRVRSANGPPIWILGKAVPLNRYDDSLQGYLGVCTDITQLKTASEDLRDRNKELRVLNEIIMKSNSDCSIEDILSTTCKLIRELVDFPHVVVSRIDMQAGTATVIAESRESHIEPAIGHTTMIKDEELFHVLQEKKQYIHIIDTAKDKRVDFIREELQAAKISSLLFFPIMVQNQLIATIALYTVAHSRYFTPQEITLLRSIIMQVEAALDRATILHQKDLLSTVVEKTADGIIITDPEGTIQYVNPAFSRMSGYRPEELQGLLCKGLYSPKQDQQTIEDMWSHITAGKAWQGTVLLRRKDGTDYYDSVQVTPVQGKNATITHFVSVHRDKTHEIELERQLRHSQKMEAIGLLAGGIAHDFNNILTAIMGHASLPLIGASGVTPDMPVYRELQEIQKNAERASQLTRQLLTFARKQIIKPSHIDINISISSLLTMMKRLLMDNIILKTELHASGTVFIDTGQFEQVLVNLIVNARDAMPDGGTLYIRTRNHYLHDQDPLIKSGEKPGEYIVIEVQDTGCGMSEEVIEHIFEPFFTTKPSGKGTGLGLATCFGIIKQHDGFFRVISQVGKGTSFKIFLPSCPAPDRTAVMPKTNGQTFPKGNETIVVAEDEVSVRHFIASALEQQGYTVHVCNNGREALEKIQNMKQPIDLVLTDIVMPLMGGFELAQHVRSLTPNTRILFMTGYADDSIDPKKIKDSCILQKPFSPTTLLQKLRQVLDTEPVGDCTE